MQPRLGVAAATQLCPALPCPSLPVQATFAMLNWALRETVTKLLFSKPMLPGPGFYAVSFSLLAIIYLIAILVPSGKPGGAGAGWAAAGSRRGGSRTQAHAAACPRDCSGLGRVPNLPPMRALPTSSLFAICSVDRHVGHRRHGSHLHRLHPAWVSRAPRMGGPCTCAVARLPWGGTGRATCLTGRMCKPPRHCLATALDSRGSPSHCLLACAPPLPPRRAAPAAPPPQAAHPARGGAHPPPERDLRSPGSHLCGAGHHHGSGYPAQRFRAGPLTLTLAGWHGQAGRGRPAQRGCRRPAPGAHGCTAPIARGGRSLLLPAAVLPLLSLAHVTHMCRIQTLLADVEGDWPSGRWWQRAERATWPAARLKRTSALPRSIQQQLGSTTPSRKPWVEPCRPASPRP